MDLSFLAAALSHQEGSETDGIHLLWSAPYPAGYAVHGYDIQRRVSRQEREITCHTLKPDELQSLHQFLRLKTPLGLVAVRRAPCPVFPNETPDEPFVIEEPQDNGEKCIDFQTSPAAIRSNPMVEEGVVFEIKDGNGDLMPQASVGTWGHFTGLNCGFALEISLPVAASVARLKLVHSAHPARIVAFNEDGTVAGQTAMRGHQGEVDQITLEGEGIKRLAVIAPRDETLLLELCFKPLEIDNIAGPIGIERTRLLRPEIELFSDRAPASSPAPAALAAISIVNVICLEYRVDLDLAHEFVQIAIGVPGVLAIAFRDGKAVDTKLVSTPGNQQEVTFENRRVNQVRLYTSRVAASLMICVDILPTPEEEATQWENVPFIAKNIQLPLRTVNPDLGSAADELALAESRLLPGESFDEPAFREMADLLNDSSNQVEINSPVWMTSVTRDKVTSPLVELRAWPFASSLLIDPAWRRMLGFGFFDDGQGLEIGKAYDYRFTGHFRRRDVSEKLFGFHTIPLGTTLPTTFHIDTVLFNTFAPARVTLFPAVPPAALRGTGRKGIALKPVTADGQCLALTFPTPVSRVGLEFETSSNHALVYEAKTSDYFIGLTGSIFSGVVPAQRRVTLEFPEPIDTLALNGQGFLYGLRLSPEIGDPDEILEEHVTIHNIRYEPTFPPQPPPFLGTKNLQEPIAPGDPLETTKKPPASMGFRLRWLPPPVSGSSPVPWPPDLAAFPPFDVLGFHLERRRVDSGGPFVEIDAQSSPTIFLGNRSSRLDPSQPQPGDDLLRFFPEEGRPEPPVSVFMGVDDVLESDEGEPGPGSLHQYRIFSVDAIGRRSSSATVGSIVRLEKHLAPPQPVGPTAAPPPGTTWPSGVQARLLQETDPNLTVADRELLGDSRNAIILQWGWTEAERERDQFAKEFRVYWQPSPPDKIIGRLQGTAALVGGFYEMAADLNQSVEADVMKGRFIRAGDYAFKVASHSDGHSIVIQLEPPEVDTSAVPQPSIFEFHPVLDGRELHPPAWEERVAIVPITEAENYDHVLRDRLTLDASQPLARVWVGVSSADDQSYIPDELPSTVPNGGRPGNESSIVPAVVQGRYRGRPDFTVPPPLPDVPEQVTDEPRTDAIPIRLDLNTLLPDVTIPAGHKVLLERVSLSDLAALTSARADDQIGVTFPGGDSSVYQLANPDDQAAFLSQIRSGEPARVEGRFMMDLVIRFAAELDPERPSRPIPPVWQPALPQPVDFGPVTDILPDDAQRYIHRIRLVDAANHISRGAAILPQIARVPSLRVPAVPEITVLPTTDDTLTINARVYDAFDLAWVILFTLVTEINSPLDERQLEKPQLLRLPNKRHLYPNDGLRLRLRDGTMLAPTTSVEVSTGTAEIPHRLLAIPVTIAHDKQVSIWAVCMTRDGISSRFSGPNTVITGPTPLTVPPLSVVATADGDLASWDPLTVTAQVAIERSTDGGTSWSRVSPWLAASTTQRIIAAAAGPRQYRLLMRGVRGLQATGEGVIPS